ncbi:MAG: hypothetical protein QGG79_00725 [Dehalococcoidales bacterium]|nr:hypothetical protein [Dehalococcoidales bacterium]
MLEGGGNMAARGCQGSSEDIAEYPLEVVALVRERLAAHCTA